MSGGDWKEMFNAGCEGDLALVEHHVKSGVDVNYAHPEFLSTPLVAAILAGQEAVALYLLDHGANPTLPSEFDAATPLQAARQVGLVAVENRLYALGVPRPPAGADPSGGGDPRSIPSRGDRDIHPTEAGRPSRRAALIWAVLYLALFSVLAWGVVVGMRMRCEGFGCMGVGVYWFAWAGVYGVAGLIGLWARLCTWRTGVARGVVQAALGVQLLAGLVLLILWWRTT